MADDSEMRDPDGLDDHDAGADGGSLAELAGVPDPIAEDEVARIVAEEQEAARRLSAIEAGRRKGGVAGAAMAGAMLAISEIYEGPRRDEIVAVAETPDEPTDIDVDGIEVNVDGVDVWAPPPRHDHDGR